MKMGVKKERNSHSGRGDSLGESLEGGKMTISGEEGKSRLKESHV